MRHAHRTLASANVILCIHNCFTKLPANANNANSLNIN